MKTTQPDDLSVAVRAGRLVALLKGEGLDKSTIEELLQPQSLSALKAILTDRLYPESEHGTRKDRRNPGFDDPGDGPAEGSGHSGDARRASGPRSGQQRPMLHDR